MEYKFPMISPALIAHYDFSVKQMNGPMDTDFGHARISISKKEKHSEKPAPEMGNISLDANATRTTMAVDVNIMTNVL